MSQLLDDKKSRKKVREIICGSELSETNNEPTFRFLNPKNDKIEKNIFGSELSEPNNELTLR